MKKRHHFVPKFYLRHFAALEPQETIWTFDTEKDEARGSTVDATAYEKYLYSVKLEDGSRRDDLEDFIADIEDKAAPLLKKLINRETLLDQERMDFASFIAIMYVRTDAFRHQYAEYMMRFHQLQMYATACHDGAFKTHIERYQRDRGAMSDEEIDQLRDSMKSPQKFKVSVAKDFTLAAFGLYDRLPPIFFNMNWTILEAQAPQYFITSDNPVIFEVPPAYQSPIYGGGIVHKMVELTFPLTAQHCLLATWNKEIFPWFAAPREMVKPINRYRAVYARRFLFGPRNDYGIRKLGAKYKESRLQLKMDGFGPEEYSPVSLRRK